MPQLQAHRHNRRWTRANVEFVWFAVAWARESTTMHSRADVCRVVGRHLHRSPNAVRTLCIRKGWWRAQNSQYWLDGGSSR